MPHKLSDIKLNEISLVDEPANKGARVQLFKRAGAVKKAMSFGEALDGTQAADDAQDMLESIECLRSALYKTIWSILDDTQAVNKQELIQKAFDDYATAVKAQLSEVQKLLAGDITMTTLNKEQIEKLQADLKKSQEDLQALTGDKTALAKKVEELTASLAKATGEATAIDKAKLTPEVREALEKSEKAATDAQVLIKSSNERIAKLEDENLTKDINTRLDVFKHAPMDRPKLVPFLKKLSTEDREFQFDMLKAQEETMKKSKLLEEVGGNGAEVDVLAKVDAQVIEFMKLDAKLTQVQARAKVWKLNPELRKEYDQARRQAH